MKITDDIRYVGVTDRAIDLFEGQYRVPNGISYNSYVILDDRIAVMDTVDAHFTHEWLDRVTQVLAGREPDYLIVQHMEPDHAANILNFMRVWRNTTVVASQKAFAMMGQFFGEEFRDNRLVVGEGSTLSLGRHQLTFLTAPMVHWPEVIVTYDATDRVLFSADGFGRFGTPDDGMPWADEARRYYIGIVGKYGAQVAALLKKAAGLDVGMICPLHGPVLSGDEMTDALRLYRIWSSYTAESDGIVIAYTSVYGNTRHAVELLADGLRAGGAPEVRVYDLARCDLSQATADAFRFGKLVLATTTYNADIFPAMRTFLCGLTERNFRGRTVGLMENGSWAPMAAKVMRGILDECRDLTFAEPVVHLRSALSDSSRAELDALADALTREYRASRSDTANKHDLRALSRIGYGLYVVTTRDGERDNGLIVNTVTQVSDSPNRIAVTVNKQNLSYHTICKTGILNVNCLTEQTPFEVFETFGFRSGRTTDKFAGWTPLRSDNGLAFLPRYINALLSLRVEQTVDLGTHGMFICSVTEARVISDADSMSYRYYQERVKPKPETGGKSGYVCKVCGYVYEGDTLPDDFICPLCKHGAADFEKIR